MTFWSMVLAVIVGIILWDVVISVVKSGYYRWKDRMENKTRKIGFEGGESSEKNRNGAQMRRIGFGAND